MVLGKSARDAFDLRAEDPRLRDRYSRHQWGQSALLAHRFEAARAEGARVAVTRTGAGSASQRNLERAGMRVCRRMEVWGSA